MTGKRLLAVAAMIEALTGLALMFQPALLVQLLLGGSIAGAGVALGRVAGFGLLSLGIACWPRFGTSFPALWAMLVYNVLTAAYLAYLWLSGGPVGRLLIPATVLHGVLALALAGAWLKHRH
jgi:hypothetical protein